MVFFWSQSHIFRRTSTCIWFSCYFFNWSWFHIISPPTLGAGRGPQGVLVFLGFPDLSILIFLLLSNILPPYKWSGKWVPPPPLPAFQRPVRSTLSPRLNWYRVGVWRCFIARFSFINSSLVALTHFVYPPR